MEKHEKKIWTACSRVVLGLHKINTTTSVRISCTSSSILLLSIHFHTRVRARIPLAHAVTRLPRATTAIPVTCTHPSTFILYITEPDKTARKKKTKHTSMFSEEGQLKITGRLQLFTSMLLLLLLLLLLQSCSCPRHEGIRTASTLARGEWSALRPAHPWKNAGTHLTVAQVRPRGGLEVFEEEENFLPLPAFKPRTTSTPPTCIHGEDGKTFIFYLLFIFFVSFKIFILLFGADAPLSPTPSYVSHPNYTEFLQTVSFFHTHMPCVCVCVCVCVRQRLEHK